MGVSSSTEMHIANCALLSAWIYDRASKTIESFPGKLEEKKADHLWSDDLKEIDFALVNEHEGKMCTYAIVYSESANAVYLIFRGTSNVADGIIDISAIPDTVNGVKLHSGFYVSIKSVVDDIFDKLSKFCETSTKTYDFFITGHSLGGGLSQIFGYMWKENVFPPDLMEKVSKLDFKVVFSLASPLVRWAPLTQSEIQFINEKNQSTDRTRFLVPDSMKAWKKDYEPLNYVVNFVFEKDIVARVPFALKCRWSLKNVTTWAVAQVNSSLLKMMASGAGAPDTVAKQLSSGFVPDVMIGYIPLGHTYLIHGTQLQNVSENHNWFMDEYDKKKGGGADDGWNVTDHLLSDTHSYRDLYRNTALLKTFSHNNVFHFGKN